MRNIADTIARLSAMHAAGIGGHAGSGSGRLTDLAGFGSNPGALQARLYRPPSLAAGAALVVVLHGCTQTAAGYDIGAGWSEMADRHGFALLFPEQQRSNNPNLCFNWFSPDDNRRGSGEALSIRQMIAKVTADGGIDPARVFVTGLSAGGAMATVMLATYPEVFAGGAIVAGLPYGCAGTIPQAFDRMRGHGVPGEADLAALVRGATDHAGPWPTISVWHGTVDATVSPINASSIVGQWRALHQAGAEPDRRDEVDGYPHRVWCDATGRAVVEEYSITGMGHGTPLATTGKEGCGQGGAYMLEAGISSTRHICRFWGLTGDRSAMDDPTAEGTAGAGEIALPSAPRGEDRQPTIHAEPLRPAASVTDAAGGVGAVIENALRAAGLMR